MAYIKGLGNLHGTLNQDTPDLGELALGQTRDEVVAFCSSVECAGAILLSTKGVPVLWNGVGDYCAKCGCVLYFKRLSCMKAKEHKADAFTRANKKKRRKHGL